MVFNSTTTPHKVILDRGARLVKDYGKYAGRIFHARMTQNASNPRHWLAPHVGVYKLNVDASLVVDGWVWVLFLVV